MLTTAAEVIRRTGVDQLPAYEDLGEMTDCAGFFAFRRFPAENPLAQVMTQDRRSAVRCLIQFIVLPPEDGAAVSSVAVNLVYSRRWHSPGRVWATYDLDAYEPNNLDAPAPEWADLYRQAPKPLSDVSFRDDVTYDNREDVFRDEEGIVVTAEQILERLYGRYCRTCGWRFRLRWRIGSALRSFVQGVVWHGQDLAMKALLNFYDIELVDKDLRSPFHKYSVSEFRRVTAADGDKPQFFGFQSSRKSFVTNLVLVAAACVAAYRLLPHTGLLRAVYNNTALTTAALVFAFLLADLLGPKILIWTICALSRLRTLTAFFTRKVPV